MQAEAPYIEAHFPAPSPVSAPVSASAPAPAPAPVPVSASVPVPAPVSVPAAPLGFTAALLAPTAGAGIRPELTRFGIGIGLAALYGVALGSRAGGLALFKHAVGVPAAMVAVAGLGVPALTIVLTLFNAPLDPPRVLSASARASASAGLVLGGFAPAAALFVTTSASSTTAAFLGALGLVIGGAVGLRRLIGDLWGAVEESDEIATKSAATVAFIGFTVFALALAARVWLLALPIFRGGAQ